MNNENFKFHIDHVITKITKNFYYQNLEPFQYGQHLASVVWPDPIFSAGKLLF